MSNKTKPKGWWVGKNVIDKTSSIVYKVVFYNKNGYKPECFDLTAWKYLGVIVEGKNLGSFNILNENHFEIYKPAIKMTMEEVCAAIGENVEIIK